jgi:branched-chain amino acid transport system ATP-binding protein
MNALEVDALHVAYDGIEALKGVSLAVHDGQLVALVGNNGAGKSTLLKTISGLCRPHAGRILLEGRSILELPPHEIVIAGVRHVPEGRRIFGRLTVRENLEMGAYTRRDHAACAHDFDRALAMFPVLKERWGQVAGTLSGGEQQMVAMSRALVGRPRVLLLDEPSMGLSPRMVEQVFEAILAVREQGVSILLVEQNATLALSVADAGYVLKSGRIVDAGNGRDLLDGDGMRSAYLG